MKVSKVLLGMLGVAVLASGCGGGTAAPGTPVAVSSSAPNAAPQSAYQQVVNRDWPAVRTASDLPVCRATLNVSTTGNPTRGMPTDVADCRAGVLEVGQAAQKLLGDLNGVAVPDNLRDSDATLRSALDLMQANAGPAADALDQGRSDAAWSHVDAQVGAYTAAHAAVLLIARG